MKYRELESILTRHAFVLVRQSKHNIYSNGLGVSIALPHTKVISKGVLRDVFKQLYPNNFSEANKQMRTALEKVG